MKRGPQTNFPINNVSSASGSQRKAFAEIDTDRSAMNGNNFSETGILRATALLHGLEPDLQNRLIEMGRRRHFSRREMLFMDGFAVDSFFCVLEGRVREYYCTGSGDECLRGVVGPGMEISLHKIFDGSREWSYSCEAISAVEVMSWRAEEFRALTTENPQLNGRVIALLSGKLESACRHTCLCRKPLAVARIAGYLLKLNRAVEEGCSNPMGTGRIPSLKPYAFAASQLCLTRETFSRSLSSLEKQEVIKVERGFVEILNKERLKELSGIVD